MSKIQLVARHEIVKTVTRPSFLFTAFGIPLISFLIIMGVSFLGSRSAGTSPGKPSTDAQGYVDPGGLIEVIPDDLPPGRFVGYDDEASARQALEAEEIVGYYLIPEDYVYGGDLVYVDPDANPFKSSGEQWPVRWLLSVNLLDGDVDLAGRVWRPMDLKVTALSAEQRRDDDNPATFFVPYATMMILYFITLMASSLLMNSVTDEKKNRVMEILMLSVSPQQMLTGKIVGLGATGLFQAVIWIGTGFVLLRVAGQALNLPPGFELPFSIVLWGILFFLLGYAVYASLMAGLGALVADTREGSQATFVIIMPMLIPLFFIGVIIQEPNAPLATLLSLFPLTAPGTMMARLAAGGVPFWQPPLAAGLLLLTAFFIVRAVAGMFRAQTLLSGQSFTLSRFFGSLLGRA